MDDGNKLLVICIIGIAVLMGYCMYKAQIEWDEECPGHSHIEEITCTKCIDERTRYCAKYIETTCEITVWDEEYEWCGE